MTSRRSRFAATTAVLTMAALSLTPVAPASSGSAGEAAANGAKATQRALDLMPAKIIARLNFSMAKRSYALCAASDITPSNQTTTINGRKYTVGTGLCPIVKGWTVYNKSLQGQGARVNGQKRTIWSSFGYPAEFAQYSAETGWSVGPAQPRIQVVGAGNNEGMANFWGFPCAVTKPQIIGGKAYPMAMCAGPIMENINNRPVEDGVQMVTNAPESATIPVGGAEITKGPLVGLEKYLYQVFQLALADNGAAPAARRAG